ncbi:protein of unknown function [Methylocaldum szegediense]|uniref:Uncharacterized protein n=1 Tax=Methylocaldum szegediense TaxID=73780 RepID=A0ABM9I6B4_9GAMM|nr:protein of unknown function [Methylocaldum szegediense]
MVAKTSDVLKPFNPGRIFVTDRVGVEHCRFYAMRRMDEQ